MLINLRALIMKLPFHLLVLKAYHAQRNRIRPAIYEAGLSPGQPKILYVLVLHGPCMQKELAAACEIDPATISRILGNMESAGLIEREAGKDKRAARVQITEKGRQAHAAVKTRFDQIVEDSLQGFSVNERAQFVDYLNRMYHNLTGHGMGWEEMTR